MKQSKSQGHVVRMLAPLEGARIDGGCATCDAYQTVEPCSAGVWQMTVHHDEHCAVLAKHQRRQAG